MSKIEFDLLGNPYCPTLKYGRGQVKYKSRCVGCTEECEFREEVESLIRAKARKNPIVLFVGSSDVTQSVAFFAKEYNVVRIVVRPEIGDDIGIQTLPKEIKDITSAIPYEIETESFQPKEECFEPKIDIKDFFSQVKVRIEDDRRKMTNALREQHKFARYQSNKFRKK